MSDVYMLVVREPSDERVRYKSWRASNREQLNHAAVMMLERLHRNPAATAVFDIQDETARTIRFTSPDPANLRVLEDYAPELGLEVIVGPVERPDDAIERLQHWIRHMGWRSLEDRAAAPDITEKEMQLVQAQLAVRAQELAEFISTWDTGRIMNRLKNTRLAVAERRILEEEAAGRESGER